MIIKVTHVDCRNMKNTNKVKPMLNPTTMNILVRITPNYIITTPTNREVCNLEVNGIYNFVSFFIYYIVNIFVNTVI